MRFHLLHLPLAAVVVLAAAPASASESFLTLEQAQQMLFPGVKLSPADYDLSNDDMDRLTDVSVTPVYRPRVRVWKAADGGWFYLDQVPGLNDRITYAVGLNADGSVKGVEVMVCLSEYGGIRGRWRTQFNGRRFARGRMTGIASISGATISAGHIVDGVTRVVATHALFTAQRR